ncbi:MAG: FKBP-type peptidyl-prolyl cis-trans isomerase [Bacteroidia bacterium]|nr:FKBP-type peptidyl-prolyl cis-trans isomerase [Bacteroidia bacterium]
MRKMLAAAAALVLITACNKSQKTEDGLIDYTIFKTEEGAREVKSGDIVLINMKGVASGKDTLLFDSYTAGKPYYIPADEPSFKELFKLLKKGDSLEFSLNADSLYLKSFGQPAPASLGSGATIKFNASIQDIYNQQEMQKKFEESNLELMTKDSISRVAYLANLQGYQTTSSGLIYQVVKKGNGKKPKKGTNVSVQYKGTLLDGTIFDQNMDGKPNFDFAVGMGQVIPGWDEGLMLMGEGDEFKFVIPSELAYGPRGGGPIPPFSTLVFEVKLVKVN